MKETKSLEFKSEVTNTFLKTVSAYANYGAGEILFGVRDDGTPCGINNPEKVCLDLENRINDSISPKPDFTLRINSQNNTIALKVSEGLDKPYLYKGKAYKSNDTSTIEVDRGELNRLTLLGTGKYYDELPAGNNELKFTILEKELQAKLGIKKLTKDICRTLNLYYSKDRFNNAGELLADTNSFPGIDIAKFGSSNDVILDRELIKNVSVIEQFAKAIKLFRRYYVYEQIKGAERITKEQIPEKAFREALANALVHRTWDINANIRVLMYTDKIEIVSPGGLPLGVSKEEYLKGYVSVLRNPTLGNVFFRLKYVEIFGTGVRRILEAYRNADVKPNFAISDNAVMVTLPSVEYQLPLDVDEQAVLEVFAANLVLASSDVSAITGFSRGKTIRLLNSLVEKNKLVKGGKGRGTKYSLT